MLDQMASAATTGKHQAGWITISTDEYDSMKNTIDVLSDVEIMDQLEEGKKKGTKVRDFEEVAKEPGI
jgi:PHD/YefM family antitoxin component YafN of YafNO toxin-antitoxin module